MIEIPKPNCMLRFVSRQVATHLDMCNLSILLMQVLTILDYDLAAFKIITIKVVILIQPITSKFDEFLILNLQKLQKNIFNVL